MSESIEELEEKINSLPKGCVVIKKIDNKPYFYQQYKQNGKTVSNFLTNEQAQIMLPQIEQRRELQKKLKELKKSQLAQDTKIEYKFQTNAIYGQGLLEMAKTATDFQKRDCFTIIQDYVYGKACDKVCLIYGLRRTGKTTLLKQLILDMSAKQRCQTVYIKARVGETIAELNQDIKNAIEKGIKYFLIDEITLIEDFIDNAALLSDVYAVQGIKFVLSGTDSLGFWFAMNEELYDRAVTVHTTFIPFKEHKRLLNLNSIDDYICYGGTLKAGEWNFNKDLIKDESASFRDNEATRQYIDTAICKNIQHSLKCYDRGNHFRHLKTLYEKDELTSAINRIIEDMNHDFTIQVLTQDFKSHDLGSAKDLLRREKNPEKRTDILDTIETEKAVSRLKEIFEIRNKEEQTIDIEEIHVKEIKEYLKALELIDVCKIDTLPSDGTREEHIIFTQPGMRFCQAEALVSTLSDDGEFIKIDQRLQNIVKAKIIEDIQGRMLEDIVFYETKRSAKRSEDVFKLKFAVGEFDMVVYEKNTNTCQVYEVKHSVEYSPQQAKHLLNEEKTELTEQRFGKITKKCVLYRGKTMIDDSGIEFKNVEDYLCEL